MKAKYAVLLAAMVIATLSRCDDDDSVRSTPTPVIKSTETIGAGWKLFTDYEFDNDGRVLSVKWKRETPTVTEGTDLYIYDENKKLSELRRSITGLVDETIRFQWLNDTIYVAKSYIKDRYRSNYFYEYNRKGQLVKVEYAVAGEGGIGSVRTSERVLTYNEDGNVFQVLDYTFIPAQAELKLESVITYKQYNNDPNPINELEIIPNLMLQKTLPAAYNIASEFGVAEYRVTYKKREDGFPSERITTSAEGKTVRTIYHYKSQR